METLALQDRGWLSCFVVVIWSIGNNPNPGYMFFGIIDEVRVWSIARTQKQIVEGMEKLLPVDPRGSLATSWGSIKG